MIDRPYVTLSCAVSLDGCLDDATPARLLLSNAEDFDRVDAVRARHDAILVGATTIRRDDPRLMIRSVPRRAARRARGLAADPTKITITASGELDPGAAFFSTGEGAKIIYAPTPVAADLRRRGLRATVVDGGGRIELDRMLADLAGRGIGRLLVEGGGTVLTEFLRSGRYDELHLAIAPIIVGDERAPRLFRSAASMTLRAPLAEVRRQGDVTLLRYETPTAGRHALARILAPARAVLLDFDGPVTPLLADGRAGRVADGMRRVLAQHRITPAEDLLRTTDPLRVLRWASRSRLGPVIAEATEQACIDGEVDAAGRAPATADADRLLTACREAGRPVIIVSNNAAEAIEAYLARHGLGPLVTAVVARVPGRPELMKPDPDPIRRALDRLGLSAADCVLVGDSVADVQAGMTAGVPVIGFARAGRRPELDLAGADVIIDELPPLAAALTRPTSASS